MRRLSLSLRFALTNTCVTPTQLTFSLKREQVIGGQV